MLLANIHIHNKAITFKADVPTPEKEKHLLSPLRAPSSNFVKSATRYCEIKLFKQNQLFWLSNLCLDSFKVILNYLFH